MEPAQGGMRFSLKTVLILLGLVMLLMLFWSYISSPMILSVTGTGKVSATADTASINFSITSSDPYAQGAATGVKAKSDQMKTLLTSAGVSPEDISKSQVTVVPAGLITTGATGFQASITMNVKTTHVSDIENLISTLYANGVYVVSQPVLTVENKSDLQNQAYSLAVADAKSQANKIALKNWKFIRKIVSVSEYASSSTATSTSGADTLTQAKNPESVQGGVFDVIKVVTVVYKLW